MGTAVLILVLPLLGVAVVAVEVPDQAGRGSIGT